MSPRAMMFTAAALLASARSSADVWADGFDAWCGDIVSARPVLPEKETRSQPVLGAVRASACIEGGDARDAIASEALGDVFPDSASWSFAVDADEESVSVATFEAEDGSLNRFAVVEQLGNSRPYFWTAEGLDAAIGQDLAAFVADRCLAGEGSSISMLDGVFAADAVEILDRGKSVSIPFERFHFAFVDDNPSANWAHPCRYVFVAEDFSAFAVLYRNFMPSVLSSETGDEIFLSPVDETGAEIPESLESVKARVYNHAKSLEAESNGMAYGQGDARRSYFVLISGGQMPKMNGIRFWSDTATFYSTLTKKYGVPKEQIKVYMSDGNSTGLDANLASTRSGVTPILVDSPKDLDGDGESDITGAATWNNISECFANYRSWLGPGDQLFVFITSHGFQDGVSGSSNYDSGFCLFDSDGYGEIMDDELADWTEHIECPVAFAIETCHSGGFIDDIVATGKRAIATACRHDEVSYGYSGGDAWTDRTIGKTIACNCWAQPFNAALRGCYTMPWTGKGGYPWDDYSVADADADEDGLVSFAEAAVYAEANDPDRDSEHPQYGSSDSTGENFYVLKQSTPYWINFHRNDSSSEKTETYEFEYGVDTWLPSLKELAWARRGYEFKGWATSAANAAAGKVWKKDLTYVSTATDAGKTLDVYAVWALKPGYFAVNFIRNDGAGTWRKVAFPYGTKTRMPSLAKGLGWARRGYDFMGWELTTANANDNTRKSPWKGDWAYLSTTVQPGETINVYARWKLKPGYYEMRFNKNDGTGKWRTLGYQTGTSARLSTISALGWTRSGHSLKGWGSSKANASKGKVWKTDGAWFKNATGTGKTISIYAIWN